MAPGPVWTGVENLALTGIRSLDRPGRSQSLYRLSYLAYSYYCRLVDIKGDLENTGTISHMSLTKIWSSLHLFT